MKITKYEKKKNGMYQIFFDDGFNVDIHEEIILKYNLLIKKQATNFEIEKMLDENKKYISYNLAIKYLSVKMRSKKEIKEYLLKKDIEFETIDEVIKLLEKDHYLDDYTYSKAYVNDKILLSNDGPYKIKNKLLDLGICEDAINKALTVFNEDIQLEKIDKLVTKYINSNRNKSVYSLKNKIFENLTNLGYSKSLINDVMDKTSFNDDNDIAKKEYTKIYKRLSRKYSGSELDYKIKQKMYALGFRNFNI